MKWPRKPNQKSVKRLSYSRHTNFNLGGVEFRRHGVSDEVDLSSPWIGEGVGWTRIRDDRKVLHLHSTNAKTEKKDDVWRHQYKGHEVSRELNNLSFTISEKLFLVCNVTNLAILFHFSRNKLCIFFQIYLATFY